MAELIFINDVIDEDSVYEIDENFLNIVTNSLDLDDEGKAESKKLYEANSSKILESLSKNNSILVNGEVQSGKTNNLIVAASSINKRKKYDVIIYLTGRLNLINNQNHERFFNIFSNFENEYMTTKIINPRGIDEATVEKIRNGKTLLMNMLKDPQKVDGLVWFLKTYNLSFILINDEGDESTLSEKGMKLFNDILDLGNEKKVITITASPYENLTYENLYEDYIVLESSPKYTGIDKFDYNILPDKEWNEQLTFVIKDWIDDTLNNKESNLLINTTTDKIEHEELSSEVKQTLYIISKFDDDSSDEVRTISEQILLSGNIEITNSDYELSNDESRKIIIGGHNLSRGVTFKKLTHQVLLSKGEKIKASTLIQRARWCGYRDVNKMKVYVNATLKEAFAELIDLQNWTMKYNFTSGDYKKKFKLKNYKRITL